MLTCDIRSCWGAEEGDKAYHAHSNVMELQGGIKWGARLNETCFERSLVRGLA